MSRPSVDELVEQLGHALAEPRAVVGEVLDQEVGEDGAVARRPVSPPIVRLGSCEIRKTSAQIRDLSSPSAPSSAGRG